MGSNFRKLVVIESDQAKKDSIRNYYDEGANDGHFHNVGPLRSRSRRSRGTPYSRDPTLSHQLAEPANNLSLNREGQGELGVLGLLAKVKGIVSSIIPSTWFKHGDRKNVAITATKKDEDNMSQIHCEERNIGFAQANDVSMRSSPVKFGYEAMDQDRLERGLESRMNRAEMEHGSENVCSSSNERAKQILKDIVEKRAIEARKATFTNLAEFFRAKGDQPMSEEEFETITQLVRSTANTTTHNLGENGFNDMKRAMGGENENLLGFGSLRYNRIRPMTENRLGVVPFSARSRRAFVGLSGQLSGLSSTLQTPATRMRPNNPLLMSNGKLTSQEHVAAAPPLLRPLDTISSTMMQEQPMQVKNYEKVDEFTTLSSLPIPAKQPPRFQDEHRVDNQSIFLTAEKKTDNQNCTIENQPVAIEAMKLDKCEKMGELAQEQTKPAPHNKSAVCEPKRTRVFSARFLDEMSSDPEVEEIEASSKKKVAIKEVTFRTERERIQNTVRERKLNREVGETKAHTNVAVIKEPSQLSIGHQKDSGVVDKRENEKAPVPKFAFDFGGSDTSASVSTADITKHAEKNEGETKGQSSTLFSAGQFTNQNKPNISLQVAEKKTTGAATEPLGSELKLPNDATGSSEISFSFVPSAATLPTVTSASSTPFTFSFGPTLNVDNTAILEQKNFLQDKQIGEMMSSKNSNEVVPEPKNPINFDFKFGVSRPTPVSGLTESNVQAKETATENNREASIQPFFSFGKSMAGELRTNSESTEKKDIKLNTNEVALVEKNSGPANFSFSTKPISFSTSTFNPTTGTSDEKPKPVFSFGSDKPSTIETERLTKDSYSSGNTTSLTPTNANILPSATTKLSESGIFNFGSGSISSFQFKPTVSGEKFGQAVPPERPTSESVVQPTFAFGSLPKATSNVSGASEGPGNQNSVMSVDDADTMPGISNTTSTILRDSVHPSTSNSGGSTWGSGGNPLPSINFAGGFSGVSSAPFTFGGAFSSQQPASGPLLQSQPASTSQITFASPSPFQFTNISTTGGLDNRTITGNNNMGIGQTQAGLPTATTTTTGSFSLGRKATTSHQPVTRRRR